MSSSFTLKWVLPFLILLTGACGTPQVAVDTSTKALTARETSLRWGVRDFAQEVYHAIDLVGHKAHKQTDGLLEKEILLWKINSSHALTMAAFQNDPEIAYLDTWVYLLQNKAAAERSTPYPNFGKAQNEVSSLWVDLLEKWEKLGESMIKQERLQEYRTFCEQFAHNHPIRDLSTIRPPLAIAWNEGKRADDSLRQMTMGTIPEGMLEMRSGFQAMAEEFYRRAQWQREYLMLLEDGDSMHFGRIYSDFNQKSSEMMHILRTVPHNFLEDGGELFDEKLEALGLRLDARVDSASAVLKQLPEDFAAIIAEERSRFSADLESLSTRVSESALEKLKAPLKMIVRLGIAAIVFVLLLLFALGFWLGSFWSGRRQRKKMET